MRFIECTFQEIVNLLTENQLYGTVMGYKAEEVVILENRSDKLRIYVRLWEGSIIIFSAGDNSGKLCKAIKNVLYFK